jgi:hypothetical protein
VKDDVTDDLTTIAGEGYNHFVRIGLGRVVKLINNYDWSFGRRLQMDV